MKWLFEGENNMPAYHMIKFQPHLYLRFRDDGRLMLFKDGQDTEFRTLLDALRFARSTGSKDDLRLTVWDAKRMKVLDTVI